MPVIIDFLNYEGGWQWTLTPFYFLNMITTYQFLQEYCRERNLPPPSSQDLYHCGRIISHSFRDFIFNQEYEAGTIVENAGFLVQEEGGKKMVVIYYPDSFKPEMTDRCDYHYSQKNKPKIQPVLSSIPPQQAPPKKRKRIPLSPSKEFSVKPSNIQ